VNKLITVNTNNKTLNFENVQYMAITK